MNASDLLKRIIAFGADETGIEDRFMGNAELYERCFREFLDEPNFAALKDGIAGRDYEKAFDAAHALKGLSGNLGTTAFYGAVSRLVESLRAQNYAHVDEEYAKVEKQRKRLKAIAAGEECDLDAEANDHLAPGANPAPKTKRAPDQLIVHSVMLLVVVFICVSYMLCRMMVGYRDNTFRESAAHLVEINSQVRLYLEERIAVDWQMAESVGDSITDSNYTDDDTAIYGMLLRKKRLWKVTDLMLYTESGFAIRADGSVVKNDIASDMIDRAREEGKYLSIIDSEIVYTVPVQTSLQFHGSKIAAVSVIQSMQTFLENMGFSSFGGYASMCLTEENGIIVSSLFSDGMPAAFNVSGIMAGREVTALDGPDEGRGGVMDTAEPAAFMMRGGVEDQYVVSSPVDTGSTPLRLFYFAPVNVVNGTMNSFSKRLLTLSISVMVLFAVFALLIFAFIYRARKKKFDESLLAHDRMFDLLVENTQAAFALFTVGRVGPVYISSNGTRVVGDSSVSLVQTKSGYEMRSGEGQNSATIREINERMHGWDGASVFKSGYLKNELNEPQYFEFQLYPVGGGKDFVAIAQDVTQAYEREQATKNALAMAERANDAKSRFLSNMSHDIRTPMNAIVNMTEFAMESAGDPKHLMEYLKTIRSASDHLLRLINDVLDMSRIESGQIVVASEPFDMKREMKRQADMVQTLCQTKHQTFICDFDGVHNTSVRGDPLKFAQIITNLLSNAVKFTPENGAVRFTAREIPALSDDLVNVQIVVEDNGIGISKQYLQYIFEPFSRADNQRVSQIEGTGLGLSICRSYVAAMGGTIACESEEGEGTVFTVELFFEKAHTAQDADGAPGPVGETPFLGKRCLVGEDNSINQTIAKTMLERLGFLVDLTSNGWECTEQFICSPKGSYDAIYLDIQMPVMDGYQAAVAIRESGHLDAGTIPIIAMTANVFAEDIEKARIAGMDGYLGKPIMSLNLIEETTKAISKRKGDWV